MTLREIWNTAEKKALVENTLSIRYELVDCRKDAVLFDIYGNAKVVNPDIQGWTLLVGSFPRIIEEVKTVSER